MDLEFNINSLPFIKQCRITEGILLAQQQPFINYLADRLSVEYIGRGPSWIDECSVHATRSFGINPDSIYYFEVLVQSLPEEG